MVHFAGEMKRRNIKTPLLIGGATTSKKHTAVKIDTENASPVVYVTDASRSVQVVENLMKQKDSYTEEISNHRNGMVISILKKNS